MPKKPAVFIMTNRKDGDLYVGVAEDLAMEVWEIKHDRGDAFCKKNATHILVYFEFHEGIHEATTRRAQLRKLNHAWKVELIEKHNSAWQDLWPEIAG